MTKKYRKYKVYKNNGVSFEYLRNQYGIPKIKAKDNNTFAYAQGYFHAKDRAVQLFLARTVAEGRLSECLIDNEESIEIDIFMRSLEFWDQAKAEVSKLEKDAITFLEYYSRGVNDYIKTHRRPFEFLLTQYKPEPWKLEDTLLIVKLMSYLGLAQSQQDIEKLIIQMIQADCSIDHLKSLFSPHLDKMNEDQIKNIKGSKTYFGITPDHIKFSNMIPKIIASNNWVISGKKSVSGAPIQCNDPHLEINRLPAIWYETIATIKDNQIKGVTMPGIPGILMGRNSHISFGFTYGFMDLVDYFIEDIKDQKYKTEESSLDIVTKNHKIFRKNNQPLDIYVHRTKSGIIEYDLKKSKIEDGKYFSRALSTEIAGAYPSIMPVLNFLDCKSVSSFTKLSRDITISCNWLVADLDGNIAYQQSGPIPRRFGNGLYPLPAWIDKNRWSGICEAGLLGNLINPKTESLVTANNQITFKDLPLSINMPMGTYRKDRINHLLNQKEKLDIEDMKRIQTDLYSHQAKIYMDDIKDFIPDTPFFDVLRTWDFCYDKDSKGATLFESFYALLLRNIFCERFIPKELWNYIAKESGILVDYYDKFDKVFFSCEESIRSLWFNKTSKEEFIKNSFNEVQNSYRDEELKAWGALRKVKMNNIFFDGKLPKVFNFLKLDYGPITIEGNRATIVQGQIFKAHGRSSTFCPSYRYISDLSSTEIHTALAGGVSDRFYSKLYKSDIKRWLNFKYKKL